MYLDLGPGVDVDLELMAAKLRFLRYYLFMYVSCPKEEEKNDCD